MPEWQEEIRKRVATLKLEPAREAEAVEELSHHLEALYREMRADGTTREDASRAVNRHPHCDGRTAAKCFGAVIRQSRQPALIGLALGMAGAFALARSLASPLYEMRAAAPLAFTMVACGLLLVAFAACYMPARRASNIDPMQALHNE